jgi:Ca2+:H+ antiporter
VVFSTVSGVLSGVDAGPAQSFAVTAVALVLLAVRNQADYALSVILQSPLQVALVVVLVAPLVGGTFTLVLSPMLLATLLISLLC